MGRGDGKRNPKKRLTEKRERDDYKKELSDIMSERSKSPMTERKSTFKDKKIDKSSFNSSRMSMGNSSMMLSTNDLELGKSIASSFKSSHSPYDKTRSSTIDNKRKKQLRVIKQRKAWYQRHDSMLCKLKQCWITVLVFFIMFIVFLCTVWKIEAGI